MPADFAKRGTTHFSEVAAQPPPAPQGLHGLQAFAAHGLHGLQALAAHGLHGLHAFAAHGLQGLHAFFAAQGLHGLQALAAQGLHGLQALAAQGLHGLQALAAQGLHGLQSTFLTAQGLQGLQSAFLTFFTAQGLQGLHVAAQAVVFVVMVTVNVIALAASPITSGTAAVVARSSLVLNFIFLVPPNVQQSAHHDWQTPRTHNLDCQGLDFF